MRGVSSGGESGWPPRGLPRWVAAAWLCVASAAAVRAHDHHVHELDVDGHWGCAHSDAEKAALESRPDGEMPVIPVTYRGEPGPVAPLRADDLPVDEGARGRMLQMSSYVHIDTSIANGDAGPMRAHLIWDAVDVLTYGAVDGLNCMSVGQINVDIYEQSFACTADQIMTVDKLTVFKGFTEWAQQRLADLVTIKQVAPGYNLTVPASTIADLGFGSGFNAGPYSDVELLVIMTSRAESTGLIAGYAYCAARDQTGRCVIGVFNWCPNILANAVNVSPSAVEQMKRTALHEILHLLDAIKCTNRISEAGVLLPISDTCTDAYDSAYGDRVVSYISSPKVLALAQEHYGCDEMIGQPIEDYKIGVGAHWESRLMGPELLSYGSGSGEGYLSEFTLMFLEDLGRYRTNASFAGRLTAPTAKTLGSNSLSLLESTTSKVIVTEDDYAWGLDPDRPGMPRWGRGEGCTFALKNARDWSSPAFPSIETQGYSSGDRYTCKTPMAYGCTHDNRMSAVCALVEYSAAYPAVEDETCRTSTSCTKNAQWPYLPATMTFSSPLGPTLGGLNPAPDYLPYRIGYWNCQDQISALGGSLTENGLKLDYAQFVGSDGGDLPGGQVQCPECRCMVSSLTELSYYTSNPILDTHGLCYAVNCWKKDGLQVAIDKGSYGFYWYDCPPTGGRILIPGYLGGLHCPVADSFCRMEVISGERFGASNLPREWFLYMMLFAIPTLLVVIMASCSTASLRTYWRWTCFGDAPKLSPLCKDYNKKKDREGGFLAELVSEGVQMKNRGILVMTSAFVLFFSVVTFVVGMIAFFSLETNPSVIWIVLWVTGAQVLNAPIQAMGIYACRSLNFWLTLTFVYAEIVMTLMMLVLSSGNVSAVLAPISWIMTVVMVANVFMGMYVMGQRTMIEALFTTSQWINFVFALLQSYSAFWLLEYTKEGSGEEQYSWVPAVAMLCAVLSFLGSVGSMLGFSAATVVIPVKNAKKSDLKKAQAMNAADSERRDKGPQLLMESKEKKSKKSKKSKKESQVTDDNEFDGASELKKIQEEFIEVPATPQMRLLLWVYLAFLIFCAIANLILVAGGYTPWLVDIESDDATKLYRLQGGSGVIVGGLYTTPSEVMELSMLNTAILVGTACLCAIGIFLRLRRVDECEDHAKVIQSAFKNMKMKRNTEKPHVVLRRSLIAYFESHSEGGDGTAPLPEGFTHEQAMRVGGRAAHESSVKNKINAIRMIGGAQGLRAAVEAGEASGASGAEGSQAGTDVSTVNVVSPKSKSGSSSDYEGTVEEVGEAPLAEV